LVQSLPNAILFQTLPELKSKLKSVKMEDNNTNFFENNSIYARFKSIGCEIK
jgi:hypothetical protein